MNRRRLGPSFRIYVVEDEEPRRSRHLSELDKAEIAALQNREAETNMTFRRLDRLVVEWI